AGPGAVDGAQRAYTGRAGGDGHRRRARLHLGPGAARATLGAGPGTGVAVPTAGAAPALATPARAAAIRASGAAGDAPRTRSAARHTWRYSALPGSAPRVA